MTPEPLRRLKRLLRNVFARGTLEHDMDAEMRDHLERATQRLIERGMSPQQARIEARREFGNLTLLQEEARDARGSRWVEALAGDVRFALRHFARRRATVAIIAAVIAVATGANTMMFSLFQAQFLRPAPAVKYDGRMARLWAQERATKTAAWNLRGFTYPELRTLADRKDLFEDLVAYTSQDVILGGRDGTEARAIHAQFVTSNYFAVLRVPLAAGAGLAHQPSDMTTPERTAVLSHAMATTLFGAASAALGRTVLINEIQLQVVGVAPRDFQGDARGMDASLWIPLSARAEIAGVSPRGLADSPSLQSFARLAPDASPDDATALARHTVSLTLPDSAVRVGMSRTADVLAMAAVPPGPDRLNSILMFVVLGTVGVLILLVGWMNVSSLMVAAAIGRRQEIAVRLSLGASRLRILRQLVTESTVLAVVGGAAGLGIASAMLSWFMKAGIGGIDVMPDAGTFAFALGISLVTGFVFGLSPALHATRGAVGTAIRDSGTGSTSQSRLQRTFVTAQIALSQPLLVMLGTLLWMLVNDVAPAGLQMRRHIVVVDAYAVPRNGKEGKSVENLDSLSARIARRPEVMGVVPEAAPFDKGWVVTTPATPNAPKSGLQTAVNLQGAAPGWLAIAELPIVLGRDVSLADTAGTAAIPVVIGNDLARAMWGNANPIGQTLGAPRLQGMDDPKMEMTIVGVYDASRGIPKLAGSGGGTDPKGEFRIYTARGKHWRTDLLLVRTRDVGESFVNDLRQLIRAEAPGLPLESVQTLAQRDAYQASMSVQEVSLVIAGAVIALLLTALGLYGVVALGVQQRTREIGIRIATGADPSAVARMFLRSGVRLAVIALLIGLPATVVGLRFGQSQGVVNQAPNFWLVGLAVSAVLLVVAGGATWRPARRAARVDPAIALRAE